MYIPVSFTPDTGSEISKMAAAGCGRGDLIYSVVCSGGVVCVSEVCVCVNINSCSSFSLSGFVALVICSSLNV